jgi:hypothetical protein
MDEKTIMRIPALPLGLMFGAIQAVISLISGIIVALTWTSIFSFVSQMPNYTGPPLTFFGILFGIGAIVIFPIFGFVAGLVEGLLVAVVYNSLAPRMGGIRLQFKEESRPTTVP